MDRLIAENQLQDIIPKIPPGGLMLEWGMGGSTAWLLDHLPHKARLVSIEHDVNWCKKAVDEIGERDNWDPTLCRGSFVGENAGPFEENPAGLHDYINRPELSQADVILVDGVARGACMVVAHAKAPGFASVYLHDAQRPWYDWAKNCLKWEDVRTIEAAPGEYPPLMWTAIVL